MPKQKIHRSLAQQRVEELATDRFRFLVDEKGYRAGLPDRSRFWTTSYYLEARIGVSISVVFNYDELVSVDLIRTHNGELLPDWNTIAVRQRWRYPVWWLRIGAPGFTPERLGDIKRLQKSVDPTNPSSYDAVLIAYSDLLRDSIDYLAVQPYEVLFPPVP